MTKTTVKTLTNKRLSVKRKTVSKNIGTLTKTNVTRKLGVTPKTTPVTAVKSIPPNSNTSGIQVVFKSNNKALFKQKYREIVKSLAKPIDACQSAIDLPFAQKKAKSASAYILAYDVLNSGNRGKLRGFVLIDLVNFKRSKYLKHMKDWVYIDVICRGKGPKNGRVASGRDMIEATKRLTRTLGKRGILLSALEPVIPYYQRLGFSIAHKQIMQGKDPCTAGTRTLPNRRWRNSVSLERREIDGIKMTLCV